MTIMPEIIEATEDRVPKQAVAWHQITSNQSIRAVIALILTVALVYQIIASGTVSEALLAIISVMIGYYFGELAPVPTKREGD